MVLAKRREVEQGILDIVAVMDDSIANGLNSEEEVLEGGLNVKRRAAAASAVPSVPQSAERRLPGGWHLGDL